MKPRGLIGLLAGVAVGLAALIAVNAIVLILVLDQQAFDHQQTQNGQKELAVVVHQVETHLDGTIRSSISKTAKQTVLKLEH